MALLAPALLLALAASLFLGGICSKVCNKTSPAGPVACSAFKPMICEDSTEWLMFHCEVNCLVPVGTRAHVWIGKIIMAIEED